MQEQSSIGKGDYQNQAFRWWKRRLESRRGGQISRKTKVLELKNVQISKVERNVLRLTPGNVNAQ
ncbi:MAG: hypothetical protein DMG78_07930 [Acidobacteria bacterium]|nr:MAG: hypothetical protein DMG78_07930 [Acidobacteriota bacterium]